MTESSWERPPHEELDNDKIREITDWCFPNDALVSVTLIPSGRANTNYKLFLGSGRSALLRVHLRDRAGAAREAAIARLIRETVPAPQPILISADEPWSVWEWLDGTLLENSPQEMAQSSRSIGEVLAAIGRHQFADSGLFDSEFEFPVKFHEACAAYIERMQECLASPIAQQRHGSRASSVERFIIANRGLLDPYRDSHQLVHGDYKPSNLLVANGRLVGVVDWEFAHSGCPLLDIAILFRHRDAQDPKSLSEFESGFTNAGGFLDPNWQLASRYLDLVNLLDFLSREDLGKRATSDVLRLIGATVQ